MGGTGVEVVRFCGAGQNQSAGFDPHRLSRDFNRTAASAIQHDMIHRMRMDIVLPGCSSPALSLHSGVQRSEPELDPVNNQRQQLGQSFPLDVLKENHVAKLYCFGGIFNFCICI